MAAHNSGDNSLLDGTRNVEFTAVIMAGGKANALYPLTEDTPLSLLSVSNRPLLSFQLEMLSRVGFRGEYLP